MKVKLCSDRDRLLSKEAYMLYFRDYLNEHPEIAKEYEALKLEIWKRYEHDRDAYTGAKTDIIRKWTAEDTKNAVFMMTDAPRRDTLSDR